MTVQTGSFASGGPDFLDLTAGLLEFSDYVGVSSYPYLIPDPDKLLTFGDPEEIPSDLLSRIADLAPGKPFAITETGYIAETLDIPELGIFQEGREEWQAAYVQQLMTELGRLDAEFVVWFVPRDHDLMNETLTKWTKRRRSCSRPLHRIAVRRTDGLHPAPSGTAASIIRNGVHERDCPTRASAPRQRE